MTTQNIDGKNAFIELKFGPKWKYISTVRTFIENFTAITIKNKKQASIIAMAVNELVENAIKYSNQESIEIQLHVLNDKKLITVIVKNYAKKEDIETLARFLEEINSMPPLEAYIKRMQESANSINNMSGIGLSRIRYESQTSIECSCNDGIVEMRAKIPFSNNGGEDE